MIRTLICENVRLLRAGLVALLSRPSDIRVVAELENVDGLLPMAIVTRADVVVVDIDMPGGPAALARVRDAVPVCRILGLFQPEAGGHVTRSAVAAAHGLLPKSASPDLVVSAVRHVAAGYGGIAPGLVRRSSSGAGNPLTPREATVLRVASEGISAAEIATRLNLSPGTVRNYISRAIAKTGTRNRLDAIRFADGQGWLPPSQRPPMPRSR